MYGCQRVTGGMFAFKAVKYGWSNGTNLSRHQYNSIGMQSIHFYHHNNLTTMPMRVHMGCGCLVGMWLSASDMRHVCLPKLWNMGRAMEQSFWGFNITPLACNPSISTITTTSQQCPWGTWVVGAWWVCNCQCQRVTWGMFVFQSCKIWAEPWNKAFEASI